MKVTTFELIKQDGYSYYYAEIRRGKEWFRYSSPTKTEEEFKDHISEILDAVLEFPQLTNGE